MYFIDCISDKIWTIHSQVVRLATFTFDKHKPSSHSLSSPILYLLFHLIPREDMIAHCFRFSRMFPRSRTFCRRQQRRQWLILTRLYTGGRESTPYLNYANFSALLSALSTTGVPKDSPVRWHDSQRHRLGRRLVPSLAKQRRDILAKRTMLQIKLELHSPRLHFNAANGERLIGDHFSLDIC